MTTPQPQTQPQTQAQGFTPRPAYRPAGGAKPPYRPGGRPGGRPTGGPGGRPGGRRFAPRARVCPLCVEKAKSVDYKDATKLGRYISERGRIDPRRRSGACAKHQRLICEAIKRARHLALLPYTSAHVFKTGGVGIVERPPRIPRERRWGAPPPPQPVAAAPQATPPQTQPAPVVSAPVAEREDSGKANVPAKEA
jgi:small subunit ribosomal protein S18